MGITPQPVEEGAGSAVSTTPETAHPPPAGRLLKKLWRASGAAGYGLGQEAFNRILERLGAEQNYGLAPGAAASRHRQGSFFRSLRLPELVLARACAEGHEGAWEHFLALYRQPLNRAAIAITGNETLGRELADLLYVELFGLTVRDGVRRSPLDSYKGRGSLMGWLRTTLAQRHVDHYRHTRRELSLDDPASGYEPPAPGPAPSALPFELLLLGKAVEEALCRQPAENRFLLSAYFIDERTLLEISRVLHVHEATISRKLRRVTGGLRKQVINNLLGYGLNRQAVLEMTNADPRDVRVNLKKILQSFSPDAFQEKAAR